MRYCCVLFVKTGSEVKVEQYIKKNLDNIHFKPFVPMKEVIFKRAGEEYRVWKPLYPSYVFIAFNKLGKEILRKLSELVYNSFDIYYLLKNPDGKICLHEKEWDIIRKLCDDNYHIQLSKGIIAGDKIYIIEGPLKGLESMVVKINRHKRIAKINLEFMGDSRTTNISLEVLEKISSEK